MLLVANLANTKCCKKYEKWQTVKLVLIWELPLSKSYPMNTNMTGFRWFSNHPCAFDESSLSIGRVKEKLHQSCPCSEHVFALTFIDMQAGGFQFLPLQTGRSASLHGLRLVRGMTLELRYYLASNDCLWINIRKRSVAYHRPLTTDSRKVSRGFLLNVPSMS